MALGREATHLGHGTKPAALTPFVMAPAVAEISAPRAISISLSLALESLLSPLLLSLDPELEEDVPF